MKKIILFSSILPIFQKWAKKMKDLAMFFLLFPKWMMKMKVNIFNSKIMETTKITDESIVKGLRPNI
jgi:hypothetical protein